MKKSILLSFIILQLASLSLGGGTVAWFSAGAGMQNTFTAGTVQISTPTLVAGGGSAFGTCTNYEWTVQNTGSKGSYLRVRPNVETFVGGESAWLGGYQWGSSWREKCFIYKKGDGTHSDPIIAYIEEGRNAVVVGHVLIWDNGTRLFMKVQMDSGIYMDELHIYTGLTEPTHTAPGLYPENIDLDSGGEHLFETSVVYNQLARPQTPQSFVSLDKGTNLYVALHTSHRHQGEGANISVQAAPGSNWIQGDEGWWYHGDSQGPTLAIPGQIVSIPFVVCVPQGFKGTIALAIEVEVVQYSNGAMDYVWPGNPY